VERTADRLSIWWGYTIPWESRVAMGWRCMGVEDFVGAEVDGDTRATGTGAVDTGGREAGACGVGDAGDVDMLGAGDTGASVWVLAQVGSGHRWRQRCTRGRVSSQSQGVLGGDAPGVCGRTRRNTLECVNEEALCQ
jgi:hypothetical protein